MPKFQLGQKVNKSKGYLFPGTIVSVFYTTSGDIRYVVEMDVFHLQHIFNEEQLVERSRTLLEIVTDFFKK